MGNGNRQESASRKAKPSSSARAAELVAGNSGAGGGFGFGFGGYAGAHTIAAAQSKAAREGSPGLIDELPAAPADSDILQHFRRLSKRDASTRLKALQALRPVLAQRNAAEITAVLPAWCQAYQRLVMDNNRMVRLEAAAVHETMVTAAGRGLAPSLKQVAGAWWLAHFDPYAEAARKSRASFQTCFPGPKGRESLLFCRCQVLEYIEEQLNSKAETLTDLQRESKEEAQDRHERVLSSTLALATDVMELVASNQGSEDPQGTSGSPEEEVRLRISALLRAPAFSKRMLQSPSPPVRRAAYSFIAHLSRRAPAAFDDILAESAPAILGAFSDTAMETHAALWDMVLSFSRALPSAWHAANARKAVLPRLYAFLKHGCHGSGKTSFPALLPLLTLLPKSLLEGPTPKVLTQLLEAVWEGLQRLLGTLGRTQPAAAAATAFVECLCWSVGQALLLPHHPDEVGPRLVMHANALAGDGADAFADAMLQALIGGLVLPNAIATPSDAAADSSAEVLQSCLARLPSWRMQLMQLAGAASVSQLNDACLSPDNKAAVVCPHITKLCLLLNKDQVDGSASGSSGAGQELRLHLVHPVVSAALEHVQKGHAPLPVATMSAQLIAEYGLPDAAPAQSDMSGTQQEEVQHAPSTPTLSALAGPLNACLISPPGSTEAAAHGELMLACLHTAPQPGSALADLLTHLSFAAPLDSRSPSDADASRDLSQDAEKKAAVACLVLQLLAASCEAGKMTIKQWQDEHMDQLAYSLITPHGFAADSSSDKVLGLLMKGAGEQSLLSSAKLAFITQQLSQHLQSSLVHVEQCHKALRTIAIFQQGLFTDGLTDAVRSQDAAEAAAEAAAALFNVSWLGHLQVCCCRPRQPLSADMGRLAAQGDSSNSSPGPEAAKLAAASQAAFAQATPLLSHASSTVPQFSSLLQSRLLDKILGAMEPYLAGASQTGSDGRQQPWQVSVSTALKQAFTVSASTHTEQSKIVSCILLTMMPAEDTDDMDAASVALIAAMGHAVGWRCILLPESQPCRGDIAALLLLQGQVHTTAAELVSCSAEVETFLQSDAGSLDDSHVRASGGTTAIALIHDVLDGLWTHVLSEADLAQRTAAAPILPGLKALCSLLQTLLVQRSTSAQATAEWFQAKVATCAVRDLPYSVLGEALPVAAPYFRSSDEALEASGLSQLSEKLTAAATAVVPLAHAVARNSGAQAQQSIEALQAVALCYSSAGGSPCASEAERKGLHALLKQQLVAEQAAAAAAAADLRTAGSTALAAADSAKQTRRQQAGEVLAQLTNATLTYSSSTLAADDWSRILRRIASGVAGAAVAMEDAAEAVANAVVAAARKLPGGRDIKPAAAVLLLSRLTSAQGSLQATATVEALTDEIELALSDSSLIDTISGEANAWVTALGALLDLASETKEVTATSEAPAFSEEWARLQPDLLADALRMVFAVGVVQACGQAAGRVAADLAEQWSALCPGMWAGLSAALEAAGSHPARLQEAATAADTWGEETGVDAVDSLLALGLGSHGDAAMQEAAVHALLAPSLLPRLSSLADSNDNDDDEEEAEAASATMRDPVAALWNAGLRRRLAQGLVAPPEQDADFILLLLSWSLLISLLLSLPPLGRARARLSQALLDVDGLVANAMDVLMPLLPLEEEAAHAKESGKSQRRAPSAQAAAAAEARAAGTAAAWSMTNELLAIGAMQEEGDEERLAAMVYRGLLRALPASCRSWFGSLRDRQLATLIEAYTTQRESPAIISQELAGVTSASWDDPVNDDADDDDDGPSTVFRVRTSLTLREAVAQLIVEEGSMLELALQLPPCWPLKSANIEPRRKVGVPEGRMRKWLLSIAALLRSQNGGLAAAIKLWRRNCSQEFTGLEECPICYSVISPTNGHLPKLSCATCSKKFHGACLFKWFSSSGKSACPHCQNAW